MPKFALWSGALALCFACACGGEETGGAQGSGSGSGGATGTGTGGGTGHGGGTTTGGSGGSGCVPKVTDTSDINRTCDKDEDCMNGYVCQEFIGFMVTHTCQILCIENCECPSETTCVEVSDKEKTWLQCNLNM